MAVVCAESKKKILMFHALYYDKNSQAFLVFPYNPFLERHKYAHTPTKQVMDMESQVLMGNEFWDLIGGANTYAQLLVILEEVRDSLKSR